MALKVNLCGHPVRIDGYINVDLSPASEICIDLEQELIPLDDGCADVVVCNSAINYFSAQRGRVILGEVFRILRPGGVTRFGALDLEIIIRCYVERDENFYFEKLPNGKDRYPGTTYCDKLNEFFSGHSIGDKHGKFVYDAETLALRFAEAGFVRIERKKLGQSVIPEAGQIDNRPEQMFFLEAFKPESATGELRLDPAASRAYLAQAVQLTGQKLSLEAWQLLLAALDADIRNRDAVVLALERIRAVGRPSSGVTLVRNHLAVCGGEDSALTLAAEELAGVDSVREKDAEQDVANPSLRGVVDEHELHLDRAMLWLARAQDNTLDGGVSAIYDMVSSRWDLSYPETTGYCIPTFLVYAELTGDARWHERALRMGDFLIKAILPGGGLGEPCGLYAPTPRVFNTSQAMLGLLALARITDEPRHRDQALRFGEFILANLNAGGEFTGFTYQGNKAHKVRAAWPLFELWRDCGEERWLRAGTAIVERALRHARPNGWFANASLVQPNRPWTHLIGYTLGALEEIRRIAPGIDCAQQLDSVLANAANGLTSACLDSGKSNQPYQGLPGTLDWNWTSRDQWTCVTGNAQLAYFLRRLATRLERDEWLAGADWLIARTKSLQFFASERDLDGGLPGSDPIDGGYLPWKQPNWGVKFFCDALLLGMGVQADGRCLG